MGKSRQNGRSGALPTMGEDTTGEIYENTQPKSEFSSELTAMDEPIINGVPQNLLNIKGVDWNVFMDEDPTGYFGEDGLETMSNILKNPIFSQNQFNEKMIQDTFKNKNYAELEDYIEELLRSNYR